MGNPVSECVSNHMGPLGINTGSLESTYVSNEDQILPFLLAEIGCMGMETKY